MERPLAERPLPFGKLALCQGDYKEFVCSHETFYWLSHGGMTHLDEVPVHLQVMDTLGGGFNVIVKIIPQAWPDDLKWAQPSERKASEDVMMPR